MFLFIVSISYFLPNINDKDVFTDDVLFILLTSKTTICFFFTFIILKRIRLYWFKSYLSAIFCVSRTNINVPNYLINSIWSIYTLSPLFWWMGSFYIILLKWNVCKYLVMCFHIILQQSVYSKSSCPCNNVLHMIII